MRDGMAHDTRPKTYDLRHAYHMYCFIYLRFGVLSVLQVSIQVLRGHRVGLIRYLALDTLVTR